MKRRKTTDNIDFRPRLGVYHQSFKAAEILISDSCSEFLRVYKETKASGYLNTAIDNVCTEIQNYSSPSKHYPKVGPVACLGPAGAGKSTTINSILGQADVAIENDGQERGTYVVHEYCGQRRGQISKFFVVVTFHPPEILSEIVEIHCNNIEQYLSDEMDDEEKSEDVELLNKYNTAVEFFHTTLCASEEFRTIKSVKEYFETYFEEHNKMPVEEMQDLVEEVRSTECGDQRRIAHQASNHAELIKVFKIYSRPAQIANSRNEVLRPSLWPIIDKLSIHQDLDLLNSGVTMADAPGIGDTNYTVLGNTLRCLSNASTILVFAGMKRCVTGKDIDQCLQKCIALGKENDTYLVITSIDDKKPFTEMELEDLDVKFANQFREAQSKIEDLGTSIQDTTAQKKAAGELARYKALDEQLAAYEQGLVDAKARLKKLTVQINCENFQLKFQDKLRELSKTKKHAPKLKVFFVSNPEYQKHANPKKNSDIPLLNREATGIPELCRLLYTLPAAGKFDRLNGIAKNKLPSLFRGIDGILNKSTLERKKEVRDIVAATLLEEFTDITTNYVQRFRAHFEGHVLNAIEEHEDHWVDKALEYANHWGTECKPVTFLAFCRRSGHWRVPKEAKKSWNVILRRLTDTVLMDAFDKFRDVLGDERRTLNGQVSNSFETLRIKVEECEGSQGVCMKSFLRYVYGIADEFIGGMDTQLKKLERQTWDVRLKCVINDDNTYLGDLMQPAYDECQKLLAASPLVTKVKSVGVRGNKLKSPMHRARCLIIRDQIEHSRLGSFGEDDRSIFSVVGDLAGKELSKFLDDFMDGLKGNAEKVRDKILEDFDNRFQDTDPGTKEDENPEAAAGLKEAASKVKEVLEGRVAELLQECADYEQTT